MFIKRNSKTKTKNREGIKSVRRGVTILTRWLKKPSLR